MCSSSLLCIKVYFLACLLCRCDGIGWDVDTERVGVGLENESSRDVWKRLVNFFGLVGLCKVWIYGFGMTVCLVYFLPIFGGIFGFEKYFKFDIVDFLFEGNNFFRRWEMISFVDSSSISKNWRGWDFGEQIWKNSFFYINFGKTFWTKLRIRIFEIQEDSKKWIFWGGGVDYILSNA